MSDWVVVASYSSNTEAELYVEILREAGIPSVVRHEGAIFGPGFSGSMSRGASIAVPAELVEEANQLIDDSTDAVIDEPT
jgi:hypothetical protein